MTGEYEPDIATGPNGAVVRAAVEAALAQERRFNRLENTTNEISTTMTSMKESFQRDMHDLHEVIAKLAESSQVRDAEAMAAAQQADARIDPVAAQVKEEATWRANHIVEHGDLTKKVGKLWSDAGNSAIVQKYWHGQMKLVWGGLAFFAFVLPSWVNLTHLLGLWG